MGIFSSTLDARNNREGKNSRGSINNRNVNRKTPATALMLAKSRYTRNSRYASIGRVANSSRFPRNFEENLGFPKMSTVDATKGRDASISRTTRYRPKTSKIRNTSNRKYDHRINKVENSRAGHIALIN